MDGTVLYSVDNPISGCIVKRPSMHCKSPYVADVLLQDGEETMCHSPSLGCCGHAENGSNVICIKLSKPNKCTHRIELSLSSDENHQTVIGINPKSGEKIVENALLHSVFRNIKLKESNSYRREYKLLNSRFDFHGFDHKNREFVLEVKNVPLADYVNVPRKERDKALKNQDISNYYNKVAYFPEGYRKKSTSVVSERALKHISELEQIATSKKMRAILCFVIQRDDANCFQPSKTDLIYRQAVQRAWLHGVEIIALQVGGKISVYPQSLDVPGKCNCTSVFQL